MRESASGRTRPPNSWLRITEGANLLSSTLRVLRAWRTCESWGGRAANVVVSAPESTSSVGYQVRERSSSELETFGECLSSSELAKSTPAAECGKGEIVRTSDIQETLLEEFGRRSTLGRKAEVNGVAEETLGGVGRATMPVSASTSE